MHDQLVTTIAEVTQLVPTWAVFSDKFLLIVSSTEIMSIKELARRAFEARNYGGEVVSCVLRCCQTYGITILSRRCFLLVDALHLYLEALKLADLPSQQQQQQQQQCQDPPEWAVLASNVAATLLKLDRPEEALQHAAAAAQVRRSV
jgi:hypothetical protein